jgi:hypothetical protein
MPQYSIFYGLNCVVAYCSAYNNLAWQMLRSVPTYATNAVLGSTIQSEEAPFRSSSMP